MSVFTPSAQFSKHWLSVPSVARQAFYQELEDIIALLKSNRPAQEFVFGHPNFNDDIAELLRVYDKTTTISTTDDHHIALTTKTMSMDEINAIEDVIHKKLSNQLDDFLSEKMAQQSDDLKIWLRQLIKEELSAIQNR